MSVGLGLGDFCGVVAVSREGGGEQIVADADGERYTPSVVGFGDEGVVSVGLAAVQGAVRNAKGTVRNFVSLLAKGYDDPAAKAAIEAQTCKTVDADGNVAFEVAHREGVATPSELCSTLLERLWQTAVTMAPDATDAVVAVPLGCPAEHTDALRECAKRAGFGIKQFVPEPVAAALGYGVGQGARRDETVVVLDMGASRATATVVTARGGALSVVGSAEDAAVGGAACDAALMKLLVKEVKKATKADISGEPKALAKLSAAAADVKHILSTNANATLFVESLHEGCDFSLKLTRGKLDAALSSTFRKCVTLVTRVLEECGVRLEDVDQVLLAGGASLPPKVKAAIGAAFDGRDVVNASIPGNEVFALGAARQAYLLRDVPSLADAPGTTAGRVGRDVCVKNAAGGMLVLLSRGTPLPASRKARLSVPEGQSSVAVELFEVEQAAEAGGDAPAPKPLGTALMTGLKPGESVTLAVEAGDDGAVAVKLSEQASGRVVSGSVAAGKT